MSAKLNLNEMYLSETMPATRSRKIVVPWIEGSVRKRSHRPAFFSIEDARSFYGKQRGFSEGSEQFQASRLTRNRFTSYFCCSVLYAVYIIAVVVCVQPQTPSLA